MSSLSGHFLVASPHLEDPNFGHSVVLMIEHDENGAFGLILNRPTNNQIEEIWEIIADSKCPTNRTLNQGGPLPGPPMAIHGDIAYADKQVVDGVFFTRERHHLEQIVECSEAPFRLIVGFASWGSGQLDDEMTMGGWLTAVATREDVFVDEIDQWSLVSGRIGLEIITSSLKPLVIPSDPSLN